MSLGCRLDADKKRVLAFKKPLEIAPAAARAFVEDMRALFAQKSTIKADEIAARQLHVLPRFQDPHEKKINLGDMKAMFLQMKDQA